MSSSISYMSVTGISGLAEIRPGAYGLPLDIGWLWDDSCFKETVRRVLLRLVILNVVVQNIMIYTHVMTSAFLGLSISCRFQLLDHDDPLNEAAAYTAWELYRWEGKETMSDKYQNFED